MMIGKFRLLTGISLVAALILALEIILTRFFAIAQGYHYAFLVVSLAFLGFGAGAVVLLATHQKRLISSEGILALLSLALGYSIALSFFLVNLLSFNPVELLWNQVKILYLPAHYLILSLPFFLGGLTISLALIRFREMAHKVYFADLLGASLGVIFAAGGFRLGGDSGVLWVLIILSVISSWLFFLWKESSKIRLGLQVFSTLMLILLGLSLSNNLTFRISDYKPLPFFLKQPGAAIRETFWDEKLRLDLFDSPGIRYAPGLSLSFTGKLPEQVGLALDAEKVSALLKQTEDLEKLEFLSYLPLSAAFLVARGERVLLLQPESDLELLLCLLNTPKEVLVFEKSPILKKVHQKHINRLKIDKIEGIEIVLKTVETRAGLKQERQKRTQFDLVVFPLPDLPGSYSTGFYGPAEDFLMTRESVRTIFELLSPDGLAAALFYFLPPPRQELRFLALWVETLEEMGLRPEEHVVIMKTIESVSFFIKKTPFLEKDLEKFELFARERFFDLLKPERPESSAAWTFIQPDLPAWEKLFHSLFSSSSRELLYRHYLFEVRPPTDDRPFFLDFLKWSKFFSIYEFFNRKIYPLFLGKYLLAFIFLQSLLAGVIIIILPLMRLTGVKLPAVKQKALIFGYFASLGAGYILVEITLFHKFILLLGHPTYSLSAVLVFLLGASGAGSLSLLRIQRKIGSRGLVFWPLVCFSVIILELVILNSSQRLFLNLNFPLRLVLSFLLIFPLGFVLGLPFPAGLRHFQVRSSLIIPFAFAVNSFFSLLGSIWSLVQAQVLGYSSVFLLGAFSYLLSFGFFYFAYHGDKANIQ